MTMNDSRIEAPPEAALIGACKSALHVGRPLRKLEAPYHAQDHTFAAERMDGSHVDNAVYEHCTFANVSFKEAELHTCDFVDCIFVDCYFRRATLTDCKFVGCRFVDCQFPHISVRSCDFRYAVFRGCYLPHSETQYSLPSEPNLREELSRNLAVEAGRQGASQEARSYRLAEIAAREANLRAAIRGASAWYREHYDTAARMRASAALLLSLMNRWLWGYSESALILLRNLAIATFVIFPIAFHLLRGQLHNSVQPPVSLGDVMLFSIQNITPTGITSGVVAVGEWARLLSSFEAIVGVVYIALLAAYLFRWSLNR